MTVKFNPAFQRGSFYNPTPGNTKRTIGKIDVNTGAYRDFGKRNSYTYPSFIPVNWQNSAKVINWPFAF